MATSPHDSPSTQPAWLAAAGVIRAVVAKQLRAPQSHPDVDDVVQETLTRLAQMPEAPSAAYAVGVAKHVAIDALRRKARTGRLFDQTEGAGDDVPAAPQSHATSLDAQAAMRALDALPPQQAQALYLFHAEGKAYEQIARDMGTSVGSIATWISRARSQLRAQLGERP